MSDQAITFIGRVLLVPFIISYILLAIYRIKVNWNHSTQRIILLMITSCIFLLVSVVSAIPKPVTLYTDIIRLTTMLYSMFFAYIVLKHLWQNKIFVPILRDPFFLITAIVCLIVVFADLTRSSFGVITDNDVVDMSIAYTISSVASYTLMSVFSVMTMQLLYKTAVLSKSLIYRIRLSFSIIAFFVIAVCCISVIFNSLLAYMGNFTYRNLFNMIYHYGKLIYFPFMFAAIMLPEKAIDYISAPLHRIQENRLRKEQQDLQYLHDKITTIVPSIKLEYGQLSIDDLVVEIADARMILWTNIQSENLTNPSPQSEAMVIRNLIDKNTVFETAGSYDPIIPPENEHKYNLSVAKHLKNLI